MSTIRLYKENVYQKEADGLITSVAAYKNKSLVTLDQSIFFPEGGGQSADKGTLAGYEVKDVFEKDGEVFHVVDCQPEDLARFRADKPVHQILDWDHRFDNMQRHCGEHIMSGVFHREFGGVNKGFHMGDNYMTLDISFENNAQHDKLTWEMAKHAELCANQVIWANLPVTTTYFTRAKQARKMPLRKVLTIDEDITVVTIGDPEDPADCVACCGTHPSTTGQIGMIKVYKVESNKGMFRVYMESGKRAFEKYQSEYDVMTALGNRLSAGTEDLMKKYLAQQEKNNEVRAQLGSLRRYYIAEEAAKIKEELKASSNSNLIKEYSVLTLDDLLNLAKELFDVIPKVLFLVHRPSNTVLLCSNGKINCSQLVKDNASIYGGKGGGNATSARAIFTKPEYVDTFIDLIDKHLR